MEIIVEAVWNFSVSRRLSKYFCLSKIEISHNNAITNQIPRRYHFYSFRTILLTFSIR